MINDEIEAVTSEGSKDMQRDQIATVSISRRVAAHIAEDDGLAGKDIATGLQIIANLRYQEIFESEMHAEEDEILLRAHHDHRGSFSQR